MTDQNRGTGRTSKALAAALAAACAGNRVCYIVSGNSMRVHARRILTELCQRAEAMMPPSFGISVGAELITIYNNGQPTGMLRLRYLEEQERRDINLGLRGTELFTLVDDHWVADVVRPQRERDAQQLADFEAVRQMLRKYGVQAVDFSATGAINFKM